MAKQRWRGLNFPYEIGVRLSLLLDLSLKTGKPPRSLQNCEIAPNWTELDLEVLSQWKRINSIICKDCGRPVAQHLHNPLLNREETVNDYIPWSLDCPASQAVAEGQSQWRRENSAAIDAYHKGLSPDPSMGLSWIAQGPGEPAPLSSFTKGK